MGADYGARLVRGITKFSWTESFRPHSFLHQSKWELACGAGAGADADADSSGVQMNAVGFDLGGVDAWVRSHHSPFVG